MLLACQKLVGTSIGIGSPSQYRFPWMLERDLALNPFPKQNMLRVDSWTSNLVSLYSIGKDMRRLSAKYNSEGRGEIPGSQEFYHHCMEASRPRQQKSK
jgi:hypothetical protein